MSDLKNHSRKAEAGISLIDVCLALILISLFTLPLIQQYKEYRYRLESGTNTGNVKLVMDAVQRYFAANDKYPMPAKLNKTHGDSDYGQPDPSTCDPSGVTCYGAVPFAALSIPYKAGLDFWNNKLLYAVSKNLTAAPGAGALRIISIEPLDEDHPETLVAKTDPDMMRYIVYTAGKDAIGAYTEDGQPVAPCPPSAKATRESENCDGDNVFFGYGGYNHGSSSVNTAKMPDSNPDYYDDYLAAQDSPPSSIWAGSKDNPNIVSMVTKLGINTDNPEVTLDVAGDIRTSPSGSQDGSIYSEQVCDTTIPDRSDPDAPDPGYNCFRPAAIGGLSAEGDSIHCPPGQALTGIAEGKARCIAAIKVVKTAKCKNSGEIAIGIDASGNLKCQKYP